MMLPRKVTVFFLLLLSTAVFGASKTITVGDVTAVLDDANKISFRWNQSTEHEIALKLLNYEERDNTSKVTRSVGFPNGTISLSEVTNDALPAKNGTIETSSVTCTYLFDYGTLKLILEVVKGSGTMVYLTEEKAVAPGNVKLTFKIDLNAALPEGTDSARVGVQFIGEVPEGLKLEGETLTSKDDRVKAFNFANYSSVGLVTEESHRVKVDFTANTLTYTFAPTFKNLEYDPVIVITAPPHTSAASFTSLSVSCLLAALFGLMMAAFLA